MFLSYRLIRNHARYVPLPRRNDHLCVTVWQWYTEPGVGERAPV
jgi:hypothetical protein